MRLEAIFHAQQKLITKVHEKLLRIVMPVYFSPGADVKPTSSLLGGRRENAKLLVIIFLAFIVRFALRCYLGSADFWVNGYGFYFEFAQRIAAGDSVSFVAGRGLYPVFLAAVTFGHQVFLPILLFQSLVGAGTVLCAALLAREIFGNAAGTIAAAITAFYPYYVVHDTALQETSLFTLLTALAILLLIRVSRSGSLGMATCAGLTFGIAVLTRATLAPFALLGSLWLAIPGVFRAGPWRQAWRTAVISTAAVALTLLPWTFWSYRLTGAGSVVSSTRIGYGLWIGNNPYTFSHYPHSSIDLSAVTALEALAPQEKAQLKELSRDGAAVDQWFRRRALEYMAEHPQRTFGNGLRKIGAAFDWLPSPRRSLWPTVVYLLSYGFAMSFGLWGMWAGRRSWREHSIFYALFVSFASITALFWGHTSHRAYLDVYLIVFAAGALEELRRSHSLRKLAL